MTDKAFFIFVTVLNLTTAAWILLALFTVKFQAMPKWHRIGLVVGSMGLLAQALRNMQFLLTGVSMGDSDLPMWFLKDLGYAIVAYHSMYLVFTGHLKLDEGAKLQAIEPPNGKTRPGQAAKKTPAKSLTKTATKATVKTPAKAIIKTPTKPSTTSKRTAK